MPMGRYPLGVTMLQGHKGGNQHRHIQPGAPSPRALVPKKPVVPSKPGQSQLEQLGAMWWWPCGVSVTWGLLLGQMPVGICLPQSIWLCLCPVHPWVPASANHPEPPPGLPSMGRTLAKVLPLCLPDDLGSFKIYSIQCKQQPKGCRYGLCLFLLQDGRESVKGQGPRDICRDMSRGSSWHGGALVLGKEKAKRQN